MDQPELILRGRKSSARFLGDAVLLEAGGVTRRIPLKAIDTVLVTGRGGRGAEIVLNSAAGEDGVYLLQVSSSAAVAAFARAVNSALPVRDAAERRADGAGLVTVVEPAVRSSGLRRWLDRHEDTVALTTVYLLVLMVPLAVWDWSAALIWGGLSLLLLPGLLLERFLLRVAEDWWLLRRRGITVLSNAAELVTGEEFQWRSYSYVDAAGATQPFVGQGKRVSKDPDRIEITYDPFDEDRASARHNWWWWLPASLGYVMALPYALAAAIWPACFFFIFAISGR